MFCHILSFSLYLTNILSLFRLDCLLHTPLHVSASVCISQEKGAFLHNHHRVTSIRTLNVGAMLLTCSRSRFHFHMLSQSWPRSPFALVLLVVQSRGRSGGSLWRLLLPGLFPSVTLSFIPLACLRAMDRYFIHVSGVSLCDVFLDWIRWHPLGNRVWVTVS